MTIHEMDAIGPVGGVSSSDYTTIHQSALPDARAGATAPSPAVTTRTAPATVNSPTVNSLTVNSPTTQSTPREVQAAVSQANVNLASYNRVLDFRVDAGTGLSIATIRNSETGAVLQEMPGANMVHLAKMLAEWSPGQTLQLDLLA